MGLAEVTATHAEALDAEIRGLRLRQAVLRIAASRGGSPEEVDRMHGRRRRIPAHPADGGGALRRPGARRGARHRNRGLQSGVALVAGKAGAALAGGVDPVSDEGRAVLGELLAEWAVAAGTADTPEFRSQLLTNLETGTDRLAEPYRQLLGIINGWPPIPSVVPAFEWVIAALQADRPG